ncbi:hypothetical protein [Mycobacteroides chelonae]|uniref:hypothetical protein n=1 Tax=Mycobacteroides chelonae TaxID=1774 RepID=UPI0004A9EADF|nr:hypothetical protein [Mycobacteroides chelonae]MBF9319425.1 hypothetical protein [Mycobacteroides chelonae]OHT70714.1 hypothetical protein BKG66_16495 [Mycobacteroides chelonae]OHT71643.1 hypothetical protein BKG67_17050 [Mycobacteroides chelonae]OHT86151.1 hypothetical protein BKG70_17200 [Mycobacteroides chelonae]
MNHMDDPDGYRDKIRELVKKRRECVENLDIANLELGEALEEYRKTFSVSSTELARRFDISPVVVEELADLSLGRSTALKSNGTIPVISQGHVPDMIEQFGRVTRVIGHVSSNAVLCESGLPIEKFYRDSEHSGRYVHCEHMLLRFGRDAWAQVERVLYGYGGMGPTYAHKALQNAGLPEEIAELVFYQNYVNYVIDDEGCAAEKEFGAAFPSEPELASDGSLVAVIRGYSWDEGVAEQVRYWIDYLDSADESLPWSNGERRISLYGSSIDAKQDGFSSAHGIPQLIIEQGDLQLWVVVSTDDDKTVWIPEELRPYARILGEFSEEMEKDDASPFRRWLTSHGSRRPRILTGRQGGISRTPTLN